MVILKKISVLIIDIFVCITIIFNPIYSVAKCKRASNMGKTFFFECFSSMYYGEESGDLTGVEIHIIQSKNCYFVLYQESEGFPTVIDLIPASIKNNIIKFFVKSRGEKYGLFKGVINDEAIEGVFLNTDNALRLKKKPSYWETATEITGTYPCKLLQIGDNNFVNFNLFITFSGNKYWMLYQECQDILSTPYLVPIKVQGPHVSFTLCTQGGMELTFVGIAAEGKMVGKFQNSNEIIQLKRQTK